MAFFDYEYLGQCEFGIPCNCPEGAIDCGEPAIAKIWWDDEGKYSMLVCKEHMRQIEIEENILSHCDTCPLSVLVDKIGECPTFEDIAKECANEIYEPGCSTGSCTHCQELVEYVQAFKEYKEGT